MKVYISGPISGLAPNTTRETRKERFNKCEAWINEHRPEWTVVNPLRVQACPDGSCHGAETRDFDGHTWECWLRHDLIAMLGCDAIVILPYWEDSAGATLEIAVARTLLMTPYHANEEGVVLL